MPKTTTTVDTKTSKSPQKAPSISFRLSQKYFMDMGWTYQPSPKPVITVVTMKAKFAHRVISPWFQERKAVHETFYSNTNNTLYIANSDKTGEVYYPDGKLAISIEKGGIDGYRTRIWVYCPEEVDKDGVKRCHQVSAVFDSLGNGVVYDYYMRKRLVYNQVEGIWWDSPLHVPVHWRWHNIVYTGSMSTMNEIDTPSHMLPTFQKAILWPPFDEPSTTSKFKAQTGSESAYNTSYESRARVLTKSEIEFLEAFDHKNYVDTNKIFPRNVGPLKPIVVQLNRYISLKLMSQSDITLSFFGRRHHTQFKIGVLYNPYDKLQVTHLEDEFPEKERIWCGFDSLPPKTQSMLKFQETFNEIKVSACKKPPTPYH